MKGTHWTGLILTIGMGCATKETMDAENSASSSTGFSDSDESEEEGSETSPEEEDESDADGNLGGLDEDDSDDEESDDGTADEGETDSETTEDEDEELILPSGLNGSVVYPPKPLVDFYAVNRDGTSRAMDDLTDGPPVIWFYPAADTYG